MMCTDFYREVFSVTICDGGVEPCAHFYLSQLCMAFISVSNDKRVQGIFFCVCPELCAVHGRCPIFGGVTNVNLIITGGPCAWEDCVTTIKRIDDVISFTTMHFINTETTVDLIIACFAIDQIIMFGSIECVIDAISSIDFGHRCGVMRAVMSC